MKTLTFLRVYECLVAGLAASVLLVALPTSAATPLQIAQEAYLKPSRSRSEGGLFGYAVAVSGNTVVVGAFYERPLGAVYVFVRNGANWIQQTELKGTDMAGGAGIFGGAVAISGDTMVIGASGESSNATGVNGNQLDESAPYAGAAYVFVRDGTTWTQQAYLKASNTEGNDRFGAAVAVSGDTVVVGASYEASTATGVNPPNGQANNLAYGTGAAYVFVRDGLSWTQQAYLKASNRPAYFGESVAISDDTVVIGAPGESSGGTGVNGIQNGHAYSSGAAYLFGRSGTTWIQRAYFKASNAEEGDKFGCSVSISGGAVVVGAEGEDSDATGSNGSQNNNDALDSGAAYVFAQNGADWIQQAYLKASFPRESSGFGHSVAISGETLLVGAPRDQRDGYDSGAAYYFGRNGTTWSQLAILQASNAGLFDLFGSAVAISGGHLVVGAYGEASRTDGIDGVQCDNSVPQAGAAYIFAVSAGPARRNAMMIVEQPAGHTLANGERVEFGNVAVNAGSQRTFTVSNNGTAPLGALDISFAGPFARDFQVSTRPSGPVPPCGSTTFTVTFSPSGAGVQTAVMRIASPADPSPLEVTLAGTGVSALLLAQQAYLKASHPAPGAEFGGSVAVSGHTVVVGAPFGFSALPGEAYIFVREGANWVQQARLTAPGDSLRRIRYFGWSVAVEGDTVVVGAPNEFRDEEEEDPIDKYGAAFVFVRRGTIWTQEAHLSASNLEGGDQFGVAVAVAGDTVAIGAQYESSNATGVNGPENNNAAPFSGAAYIFLRTGTIWTQQAYLKASNTDPADAFGGSIALSGNWAIVGAPGESSSTEVGVNGNGNNNDALHSGAAYVFRRDGMTWTQEAFLKASGRFYRSSDLFGSSVALSDDTAVIGARHEGSQSTGVNGDEDNAELNFSGAAYVFVRNGTTWIREAYLKPSNTALDDTFGSSVALSGDTVVVGAPLEASGATGVNGSQTSESAPLSGAAYVFARDGTTWSQRSYLKASNTDIDDRFGAAVAISGNILVAGAPRESNNAEGVNAPGDNNDAPRSGAAYLFAGSLENSVPAFPEYFIDAFAGTEIAGFSGDGGLPANARLEGVGGIALDAAGKMYLADTRNHRVRVVQNGIINTFAGTGVEGFGGDGGLATQAHLDFPSHVAVGGDGNIYISDSGNDRVRRVDAQGVITTFAGTGVRGFGGDGGLATQARLNFPGGLAVGGDGNIYISDSRNDRVRRVDAQGVITTFAGAGASALHGDGGPATEAFLYQPWGLALDRDGALYIAQPELNRVRRVDANGVIATFAGTGRRAFGGDGGPATQAHFAIPYGVAVNSLNEVFIADTYNFRIRRVDTNGIVASVAGTGRSGSSGNGGPALGANVQAIGSLTVDAAGKVFLSGDSEVRQLVPTGRAISLIPNYASTPPPGGDLNIGSSREGFLQIKNSPNSPVDLTIDSIEFVPPLPPNLTLAMENPPPYRIPPGGSLRVRLPWDGTGESTGERLEVRSSDPFLPVATYPIWYSERSLFVRSSEFAFLEMLSTGNLPPPVEPSRLARQSVALNSPQTTTLTLNPSGVQRLIAEIPSFLGGGTVLLSNFIGSVSLSALPIPNETNRADLRIEGGGFTAPSFRLPGGLETGPNRLTFGPPDQSGGTLLLASGSYTAFATATIVNNLIPNGVTVQGKYHGNYNAETGQVSLRSESEDVFQRSAQVLFSHSQNGLQLTWANTNLLEQATNILGPWQPLSNSASPYSVIMTNRQQFFRQQPDP